MGVGYQVSALHRSAYVDWSEIPPSADVQDFSLPIPDGVRVTSWEVVEKRVRGPSRSDIESWQARLAEKYREPLGEVIDWNEASEFAEGEDVASSAPVRLCYVAAMLDLHGERKAANMLLGLRGGRSTRKQNRVPATPAERDDLVAVPSEHDH